MSDFLEEKNLVEIYKLARRIPFSKFNKRILNFSIVIFLVNGFFIPTDEIYLKVSSASTFLIGAVVTTMGFLIAGYTIFCTAMSPELSLQMHKSKGTYLSSLLKESHFLFLRVFVYYLLYTFLMILVIAFSGSNGVVVSLIQKTAYYDFFVFFINLFMYVVIFSGAIFIVLQLASFIFNIYHTVMTSLAYYQVLKGEKAKE